LCQLGDTLPRSPVKVGLHRGMRAPYRMSRQRTSRLPRPHSSRQDSRNQVTFPNCCCAFREAYSALIPSALFFSAINRLGERYGSGGPRCRLKRDRGVHAFHKCRTSIALRKVFGPFGPEATQTLGSLFALDFLEPGGGEGSGSLDGLFSGAETQFPVLGLPLAARILEFHLLA